MRKSILGLSAIALVALSAPAFAEDAKDDGLGLSITGGASVVSDYRFRGISQSAKDWAIQGSVTVTHTSGAYIGFWGSSDTIGAASGTEIDVIGGYSRKLTDSITGDIGVTYYIYPNRAGLQSLVNPKSANELVEPYVDLSTTVGPVSGKIGFAWAPKQDFFFDGTRRNDNTYLWGDASVGVPNTPVKLTGHVGWTSNHYNRSLYNDATTSRADIVDFGIGASYSYKALTFGVNFVTTDLPSRYAARKGTTTGFPNSKQGVLAGDNQVVFSIGASF